jgi:hypothetical protein
MASDAEEVYPSTHCPWLFPGPARLARHVSASRARYGGSPMQVLTAPASFGHSDCERIVGAALAQPVLAVTSLAYVAARDGRAVLGDAGEGAAGWGCRKSRTMAVLSLPRTVAVLPSPGSSRAVLPELAKLRSPVTVAMFPSPTDASARLLSPLTVAVLPSPIPANARLLRRRRSRCCCRRRSWSFAVAL